jgi:hypothetical protein
MTNPMTTTGDTIYSSSGSTPARLGIGTAGQVLTVNSGATAPEWKTPAGGSTFVGARATGTTGQTINNNTYTAVLWTVDTFDTDAIHDTSTNTDRFTVPSGKAGYWTISSIVLWAGDSGGERRIKIYKNGSGDTLTDYRMSGQGTTGVSLAINSTFYLTVGDYLSIYVYQDTGGSLNLDREISSCSFYYLGA